MDKNFAWAIVFILGIGLIASVAIKRGINNPKKAPAAEEFDWNRPVNPPVDPKPQPPKPQVLPSVPTSYAQALQIAKQQKKDVLLFFGADWCKYCEEMKNGALKNSKVKEKMKKFVYYYVDTDKERALATKFDVSRIPVYIILDANNEQAKKTGRGKKDARSFERWLSGGGEIRPDFLPKRRPRFVVRDDVLGVGPVNTNGPIK